MSTKNNKSKIQTIFSTGAGLTATFGILLILISVEFVNFYRLKTSIQGVSHTHEVQLTLRQLLSTLQDTETGQRGYLLSKKLHYLEPYHSAIKEVEHVIKNLQRLTIDNQKQQTNITEIKVLINKKLYELNKTILLQKKQMTKEALELVATDSGKNIMDQLRVAIRNMEKEENQLLKIRKQSFELSTNISLIIRWLSIFLLILMGVLLNHRARKILEERINDDKSLTETNAALEESYLRLRTLTNNQRKDFEAQSAELDFQKKALDEHAIVSITGIDGNIIYINNKFCQISGYTQEELLGNKHSVLKSNEHSVEFYNDLWKTISKGKVWNGDIKNINKSGGAYWAHTTIVPYINENGEPFKYVEISTDITDRKNAELAALKANKAKSEFLSSMSHELRTPLNAILGFAQLLELKSTTISENELANVKEIISGGQHLLRLVNEVLDLAKIESGNLDIVLAEVDIGEVLEQSLHLIKPLADKRHIKLSNLVSEKKCSVYADDIRLKQVLVNLLSNAVKYNCDNGEIVVNSNVVDKQRLRISITDSGVGVSKEDIEKLYTPFERIDEKYNVEGAGIGLAITKNLIEMMKGTIGVESTKGKGSTFWIEIALTN